jgi:hypothetical protein
VQKPTLSFNTSKVERLKRNAAQLQSDKIKYAGRNSQNYLAKKLPEIEMEFRKVGEIY